MLHNLAKKAEDFEDLGDDFYDKNCFKEAIDAYYQALELGSDQQSYLFSQLGNSYFKLENYIEAELQYKKSLKLKEDNDIRVNLGDAYFRQNKKRDAINCFINALKNNSQDAAIYSRLGDVYCASGNNVQALMAHIYAVKLNPEYNKYYDRVLERCSIPIEARVQNCILNMNESDYLGYFYDQILKGPIPDYKSLAGLEFTGRKDVSNNNYLTVPNASQNISVKFSKKNSDMKSKSLNSLPTPKGRRVSSTTTG